MQLFAILLAARPPDQAQPEDASWKSTLAWTRRVIAVTWWMPDIVSPFLGPCADISKVIPRGPNGLVPPPAVAASERRAAGRRHGRA